MQVVMIMGSDSDWPKLEGAWGLLKEFGVEVGVRVLSAHRTPEACAAFVREAENKGTKVFIAAAGLAAHLPGVIAAHTRRPVIGVPLAVGPLQGKDALYSVVQMPAGVPVATMGIDNAYNAALLAVAVLALEDAGIDEALTQFYQQQREAVLAKDKRLQAKLRQGMGREE